MKSITECTSIDKNSGIPLDTTVSMNKWDLQPEVFDCIREDYKTFLQNIKNPQKDEFYIPIAVDNMIRRNGKKVRVLETT